MCTSKASLLKQSDLWCVGCYSINVSAYTCVCIYTFCVHYTCIVIITYNIVLLLIMQFIQTLVEGKLLWHVLYSLY